MQNSFINPKQEQEYLRYLHSIFLVWKHSRENCRSRISNEVVDQSMNNLYRYYKLPLHDTIVWLGKRRCVSADLNMFCIKSQLAG